MANKIIHNTEFPQGKLVVLTADETADKEAREVASKARGDAKTARLAAQIEADEQKVIDKASANIKLKAAEYTPLTEAEADAITK